jgi:hypothetical protein
VLKNLVFAAQTERLLAITAKQRSAIPLADNHVIFRREGDGTFVADRPPIVAIAEENGAHEVWYENDPFAAQLRTLLFRGSPRGWLRSTHRQIFHPHLRVKDVDTVALARELLDLCSSFGITSRNGCAPEQTRPFVVLHCERQSSQSQRNKRVQVS